MKMVAFSQEKSNSDLRYWQPSTVTWGKIVPIRSSFNWIIVAENSWVANFNLIILIEPSLEADSAFSLSPLNSEMQIVFFFSKASWRKKN